MGAFATAIHRWAGLAVALFLSVSGLTGAVISWDHEIDGWLNRKLHDTPSRGPFKDPFELAAAVEAHDPRARVQAGRRVFSSASMNIFGTSKPVCSVIS
ncbi:putative iron-regulated membrane protein [Variovorax boronicumulans]|nr:putative iron-regulated membrane protein [Variovorax boronicumulans]